MDITRLVQIGTVTALNPGNHTAKVTFPSTGIPSGWLKVVQHHSAALFIQPDAEHTHEITDTYTGGGSASTIPNHDHLPGSHLTYWMPKMGERVLVLFLPLDDGDGFILGGI